MGSALIVESHDEDGEHVVKTYEVYELASALIEFLRAMEECEDARLIWSS